MKVYTKKERYEQIKDYKTMSFINHYRYITDSRLQLQAVKKQCKIILRSNKEAEFAAPSVAANEPLK